MNPMDHAHAQDGNNTDTDNTVSAGEYHRPELHLTAESGILEAPAGVLLDGETWHVFYQYRAAPNQQSRWGHSFSQDLPFYWLECDDVLAPVGGEINLRAGSVAAVGNGINLYFTSVTSTAANIWAAHYDQLDKICEISDEPGTIDPGVTRIGRMVGDMEGLTRFRSPSVVPDWADDDRFEGHSGWIMLALTGSSEEPVPVILHSPDGAAWSLTGQLELAGDAGFGKATLPGSDLPPVVSPRLIRLRDEVDGEIYDVLLVTLEQDSREVAGYLVGRLNGTTFQIVSGFRRLDYGHDFTRPRNTNVTPGTVDGDRRYEKAILFGLLNGRGRADDANNHPSLEAEGWANALSLPREVTLQGGTIFQTPPRGLPDAVKHSSRARSWTGLLEVPEGSSVTVTLADASGAPAATITHAGSTLTLDRSPARAFGQRFADDSPATAPLDASDSDSLTIIVDGSTVEVFADGGLVAMASRVYFEGGCGAISIDTTGEAHVLRDFERSGS